MNIRQVRKKIKTVSNVKKITKAMQLVAAIKMKKAQADFIEGQPYRETLEKIIKILVTKVNRKVSKLLTIREKQRELIILLSSNKGLCGSFNINLLNFTLKNIDFEKADFIVIGKKGAFFISRFGGKILADFSTDYPLTAVSAILEMGLNKFVQNEYQVVSLVYNKFISTLKVQPIKETILPVCIQPEDLSRFEAKQEYLIEPRPELIIDEVLRSFVEGKIRDAIMSSEAGEHSSRMIAMKSATDNATDLILDLTMLRNKLRQEKITYELLDMITAKESVEFV